MRSGTVHAKTATAAARRNHVAAMAESQQRKFDSQHLADRRFHGCVHSRRQPFGAAYFGLMAISHWTLAHHRTECQARPHPEERSAGPRLEGWAALVLRDARKSALL